MPYVKVPEFKQNEVIASDQFNDAFSSVQKICDKLDGSNFSDESLGFDELPNEISLTKDDHVPSHQILFSGQTINHSDEFVDPFGNFSDDLYADTRTANRNHPKNNLITLTGLLGGEKFIIRASCRIFIPDMGARTYYDGIPAVMKVGLFQFPGETTIADGSINAATKRLRSTEQHFRVAFSTKVPSSSSGDAFARDESTTSPGSLIRFRDRNYGESWEYRDNRGDDEFGRPGHDYEHYDPAQNQDRMYMAGHFTYTTCYVYDHPTVGSANSTQSFGIMCHLSGMSTGISKVDNVAGGKSGCVTPKKLPATITDGSVHTYQVRR